MKIGLVRVRTIENIEAMDNHGPLIEKVFPGLRVTRRSIEDQPFGIHNEQTEAIAIPKVVALAKALEGMDAIIIDCASDPGLPELKRDLSIPVIGAGESLARVSQTLGNSIGVLTIAERVPKGVEKVLGRDLAAWKKVEGVNTGLDLELEASYRNALNAAKEMVRQGCDVIALACTGFTTTQMAPKIAQELRAPVVDPILAAGSVAYNLMLTKEGWRRQCP